MRRRRQRNPLLMRIIVISVLVHILALPVLAHYGAFQKLQRQFGGNIEARLIKLPPPEKIKTEVKKPQPQHLAHKTPAARKSASSASHPHQMAQKSNINQPKVVASAGGPGGGGGDQPTIDNSGSGKVGQVPAENKPAGPVPGTGSNTAPPTPQPQPAVRQETPPPVTPAPPPKPKEETPAPPPPVKKEPVFTTAEPIPSQSPKPAIPDDLRSDALDKTVVAEFTVGPDGTPSNVKITQSTGNDALDRIALDTAKQWRFKPATRDGQPIESRVRLHIEFQVS